MSRVYDLYLRDILRAIGRIDTLLADLTRESFTAENTQVDAVLFNLMVIGEAVKNLPDDKRNRYPAIRWRDIGRFRDRVVHHYFALDLDIIWEIVTVHLRPLKEAAEQLLSDSEHKPAEG